MSNVAYMYVRTRDHYLMKKITLSLVSTHIMMADDKTKVVDREKFFRCRNYQDGACAYVNVCFSCLLAASLD